ncbi:unnamed protein product [Protopolystoma xenopodis]|uniref:Uncharacterized protein n=1 Tax=Protopolystoma xenopodis TaxID=117903 RepID=A0A3S5C7U8_9PLAT|nr:unnamed protein product [Protopolystoma xenopodis]
MDDVQKCPSQTRIEYHSVPSSYAPSVQLAVKPFALYPFVWLSRFSAVPASPLFPQAWLTSLRPPLHKLDASAALELFEPFFTLPLACRRYQTPPVLTRPQTVCLHSTPLHSTPLHSTPVLS